MRRLLRTERARQDLIDIWLYVADNDPTAADGVLDRIDNACRLLTASPEMGPARNDIRPGLRYLPVTPYLILYRATDTTLEIVRVLHGRRDVPRLF